MSAASLDIPEQVGHAAVVLGDRSKENPDEHQDDHDEKRDTEQLREELEKRPAALARRYGYGTNILSGQIAFAACGWLLLPLLGVHPSRAGG